MARWDERKGQVVIVPDKSSLRLGVRIQAGKDLTISRASKVSANIPLSAGSGRSPFEGRRYPFVTGCGFKSDDAFDFYSSVDL